MSEDRQFLKDAATALLGAIAREHPLGHQDCKAARFVLLPALAPFGTALPQDLHDGRADAKYGASRLLHRGAQR
jgi:hypothetical protein